MLTRYEYLLRNSEALNYRMSSLFHGALMELLPSDYVEALHISQLHPFSQHLERRNNEWFWVLNTLTEKDDEVFRNALKDVRTIELRKHNITLGLELHQTQQMDDSELKEMFYSGEEESFFQVRFLTPASFKRNGSYLIYPDLFCIFQSLMNMQDAAEDRGYMDQDTLDELVEHSKIVRYKLNSTYFYLEGVKIPSFIGAITIRMTGTSTMKRFAKMLFTFGEYSGVGIKTSLGMGVIVLEKEDNKSGIKRRSGEQES